MVIFCRAVNIPLELLIFPYRSIFPQLAAPPLHTSVCGVVEVERLTRRLRGEEVEEVRGEEVREPEHSLYIYSRNVS